MKSSIRTTVCLFACDDSPQSFEHLLWTVLNHVAPGEIELRLGFVRAEVDFALNLGSLCPDGVTPQYYLLPGGIERFQWFGRDGLRKAGRKAGDIQGSFGVRKRSLNVPNFPNTQESGDSLTGGYTRGITDTTTTTDVDSYSDASGAVSVNESSSTTTTGTQTGNYVTGGYSLTNSASESYSMTETASAFTLTETGSESNNTNENGNTISGGYTRTIMGTDTYSMTETGTNSGNPFSEVVTGTDTVTLTETGNTGTQAYDRSIVGTGTYTRTDSGTGATLSNVPSGTLSYTATETANVLGAEFSQAETGTNRYSLLEHFTNVSNTGNGNTPGNMNFSPFGQPFVDPNPPFQDPVETAITGAIIAYIRVLDARLSSPLYAVRLQATRNLKMISEQYPELVAFVFSTVPVPATEVEHIRRRGEVSTYSALYQAWLRARPPL
jgi:hypothetical protein